MQLLSPETIAKDAKDRTNEAKQRTAAANAEEAKSLQRLNAVKTNEAAEIQRIETETAGATASLAVRKEILENEVGALEARKAEAMRPIHEIRREAEAQKAENEKTAAQLTADRAATASLREDLAEKIDSVSDREQLAAEKSDDANKRIRAAEAEEKRVKQSEDELADRWVQFHEAVAQENGKIKERESRVAAAEKTLDIRHESQELRQTEQDEHDRQIKDRYDALGHAVDEARKNGITFE